MTEFPGSDQDPAAAVPTRRVGWYRDRNTGKRQFWNGVSWIDVAGEVTPFTIEPPRSTPPAPKSPVTHQDASDGRRKALIGVAALLVVVAAIVLGVVLSNTGSTPTRRVTSPTVAPADAPSDAPTSSPSASAPSTSVSPSTTNGSGVGASVTPVSTIAVATGTPHSIVLVGDSITARAEPDIEQALRAYRVVPDGVAGSTMAEHLGTITSIEAKGGAYDWVIELGTNDAIGANANWASDYSNEVSALEGQPCVVFVTVNPKLGPVSTGIDQAITSAVASHPDFRTLDWGNIEFRKPHWIVSDGIHPSKTGEAELARLEHKAVLGCSAS